MNTILYKVTITTETPFNISTGVKDNGFIKDYSVKDSYGNPYIPGSTIKGQIRHNYMMINGEERAKVIFGDGGFNPSRIIVDNFYLKDRTSLSYVRYGNAMDRFRHTTKDGALYSKEVVEGTFEGEIEVEIDNELEKDNIFLAIKMIKAIGGGKSTGLGKITIEIEEV